MTARPDPLVHLLGVSRHGAEKVGITILEEETALWGGGTACRIGQEAGLADDVATAAELLATQVRSEREAVSGVNLNEELANLLRFQHAFEASAKLVAVADRVLDELVNLVR